MNNKIKKMFMIYCYEWFRESDAKFFNDYVLREHPYPRKFAEYTYKQNTDFLKQFIEKNNIDLKDFILYDKPRIEDGKTPKFIKRVRGEMKEIEFT